MGSRKDSQSQPRPSPKKYMYVPLTSHPISILLLLTTSPLALAWAPSPLGEQLGEPLAPGSQKHLSLTDVFRCSGYHE